MTTPATTTAAQTSLVLKRLLPAPRDKVFAAWTRPEIMKKWLAPCGARLRKNRST